MNKHYSVDDNQKQKKLPFPWGPDATAVRVQCMSHGKPTRQLQILQRVVTNNYKEDVVCFLLGNSPASEFYMPTFRNTLSVPSS